MDLDARARESFMAFDRDGDGNLNDAEFLNAVRGCGFIIKQRDENQVLQAYGIKAGGTARFPAFQKAVQDLSGKSDARNEILQMFKMFDREGNGKIGSLELKTVLQNVGEILSENERDGLLQLASTGPTVDYARLIDALLS